ncbi:hypothetical protein HYC85_000289 [Camellia sinensis]|uniref:Uncharacterized protein n=1 Tax=Camellia sinensis TaxID=4442 RepID=A0A7J7I223_CAMSI|nr:hypothetical protein HYC85_000289 [Camellia sinensis]
MSCNNESIISKGSVRSFSTLVNFRMVKLVAQSLLLGLYLQVLAVFAVDVHRLNIWPMPQSVSNGHQILHMSKDFELMTQGTKYPDASGILKDGFSRLLDVVQAAHVVDGNFSHFDQSVLLQGIHVLLWHFCLGLNIN